MFNHFCPSAPLNNASCSDGMVGQQPDKDDGDINTLLGNKSEVWKHFGLRRKDRSMDKSHAACKQCQYKITYSGNTTNLARHLWKNMSLSHMLAALMCQMPACQPHPWPAFICKSWTTTLKAVSITVAISRFTSKDRPLKNQGFCELLHSTWWPWLFKF